MDIYFDSRYGKICEKIESGSSEVFEFESNKGLISNMFIKREISIDIKGETYYDIVTPYGYGGPIIRKCKDEDKDELINQYRAAFSKYCDENKIVSEFVRFHPLVSNAEDFQDCYETTCIRNTIGTNLRDYDDPIQSEFSKSCRKNINKALKEGVSYRVTDTPQEKDINNFMEIYYSTMNRNNASEFYYFNKDYIIECVEKFPNNIVIVEAIYSNKTIAMGFYFKYDKTIHIHLSGTLSEFLYLSPAYILRYAVSLWGKENGYEMIHHGGGRTNQPDDSLYRFKKQFGKNTEFNFFVGKRIWNTRIYDELNRILNVDESTEYFPSYRAKL